LVFFLFQAEDGIRDRNVTGVQTCALPISNVLLSNCGRSISAKPKLIVNNNNPLAIIIIGCLNFIRALDQICLLALKSTTSRIISTNEKISVQYTKSIILVPKLPNFIDYVTKDKVIKSLLNRKNTTFEKSNKLKKEYIIIIYPPTRRPLANNAIPRKTNVELNGLISKRTC